MNGQKVTDPLDLGGKLMEIDDAKFRQVVGLLEHMGDNPQVLEALSAIRPRLAEVKPKRRPTLKRLFCEPFEDLFQPYGDTISTLCTIERALVQRLWPMIAEAVGPERVKEFADRQRAGGAQGAAVSAPFWRACAEALAGLAGDLRSGRVAERLEMRLTPPRMQAIHDIACALSIGEAVEALKRELAPKPLAKLRSDHVENLQVIGRKVAKTEPNALRVFVLIACARLADPAMLLGALWNMDFGQKGEDRAALFGELAGNVVQQIEERVSAMKGVSGQVTDRLAAAGLAVEVVASLDATRQAMETSRRKEFDQRLKEVRAAVHGLVRGQILDNAETGILQTTGGGGGGADREGVRQAENHARALRKCATIADSLGLRGELRAVTDKTVDALTRAARDALFAGAAGGGAGGGGAGGGGAGGGGAGGGGGGGDPRAGYAAVRMIELISGPAEANRILTTIQTAGQTAGPPPGR